MSFIEEFQERGYFYQCTDLDALKKLDAERMVTFYVGIDCTADSLHVGHLMQIMILRLLQKYGHKPIIIVGGSTTKIGDPTGKDQTRKMLTDEDIENNIKGILKSLSKFITFGNNKNDAILLNNSEWLDKIGYIEFLREYGKDISVNRMLTMDSVKSRLEREKPLTFLEFNYMLLQAYDFMYLHDKYNCDVQIGGSDQWGNIVMGVEFIRKKLSSQSFGLTTQLLTTASGAKMGKTVGGAIWINEDKLSPYDYFQYWRNVEDADVVKFSKLFAEFNEAEQKEFENLVAENINEAKKLLAFRVTSLCHGEENAENARETARKVFEEGATGEELPEHEIQKSELEAGVMLVQIIADANLTASKSEAKKLIRGGGVRINNDRIDDEHHKLKLEEFSEKDTLKLSVGKKRHILVKIK